MFHRLLAKNRTLTVRARRYRGPAMRRCGCDVRQLQDLWTDLNFLSGCGSDTHLLPNCSVHKLSVTNLPSYLQHQRPPPPTPRPFVPVFQREGRLKTRRPIQNSQTHMAASSSTVKPPYQGSVCVFGPAVLIPHTMKLYHSKHCLMEADSRPIYLRLLLV